MRFRCNQKEKLRTAKNKKTHDLIGTTEQQGHPLKCGIYSIFCILNKSFNGCPRKGLKGDFFLLMTMPRDVTSQMFNQEVQLQVRAESAAKADIVGHFRK